MLSYQHKFHAGNHADVLKHICVLAVIEKLAAKPKGFFWLDTHAGDGVYNLYSENHADAYAFSKLLSVEPTTPLLKQYSQIVKPFFDKQKYPGSPMFVESFAMSQRLQKVSLHFNELSPKSHSKLKQHLSAKNNIYERDAFEVLRALMPPMPRRGAVLIDPPYEQSKEYQQVAAAVTEATKKWPQGVFIIWYPLLSPNRINRDTQALEINPKCGLSESMIKKITNQISLPCLDIRFGEQDIDTNAGMYGSGVLIINPPWQLDEAIVGVMPALKENIGSGQNITGSVNWLRKPA